MKNRSKDDKTDLAVDDMIAQAFTFFFAGVDSSSTLMCFATHEIVKGHPKRLQNEDHVLENNSEHLMKHLMKRLMVWNI